MSRMLPDLGFRPGAVSPPAVACPPFAISERAGEELNEPSSYIDAVLGDRP